MLRGYSSMVVECRDERRDEGDAESQAPPEVRLSPREGRDASCPAANARQLVKTRCNDACRENAAAASHKSLPTLTRIEMLGPAWRGTRQLPWRRPRGEARLVQPKPQTITHDTHAIGLRTHGAMQGQQRDVEHTPPYTLQLSIRRLVAGSDKRSNSS